MSGLFAVSISTATITAMGRRTARRFEPFLAHVADVIRTAVPVKHLDETGLRIAARTRWLHVLCTPFLTVLRIGAGRGDVAVAAGIVLLWFRQAIVCLLDTHPVPRLGVGRQGEAGIAQQRVGDELRGELPAFGIALAPARVVLERAGHDDARHRGLDDVRICVRDASGRVADLVPVARERLPARIGAEREPERQAPEEGLLAQELGHAVAGALRGLRLHAGGHHAASRAGSTGVTK